MTTVAMPTDQTAAVDKAARWYQRCSHRPFLLAGCAGTGKTHLARRIADELAGDAVAFVAPTGKAASVLRSKGCDNAATIHSQIYVPAAQRRVELLVAQEELADLEADEDPDKTRIAILRGRIEDLSAPQWTLREPEKAFGGKKPRLIVVDEASMVPDWIAADLAKFGIPVLALGDEAQLSPIGGKPGYPGPADATLTTFHRYGASAPLMDLATAARTRAALPRWDGTAGLFAGTYQVEHLAKFDQVLVGRNSTRWTIVNALRAAEGRTPGVPEPGDKLLVLRNEPSHDIVNGDQATVARVDLAFRAWQITTTCGSTWKVDRRGFLDQAGQDAAKNDRRSNLVAATFANAVTTHKAQGSQWPTVAVIDESAAFGSDRHKWLYTAATRASEQCILLARPPAITTVLRSAAA